MVFKKTGQDILRIIHQAFQDREIDKDIVFLGYDGFLKHASHVVYAALEYTQHAKEPIGHYAVLIVARGGI